MKRLLVTLLAVVAMTLAYAVPAGAGSITSVQPVSISITIDALSGEGVFDLYLRRGHLGVDGTVHDEMIGTFIPTGFRGCVTPEGDPYEQLASGSLFGEHKHFTVVHPDGSVSGFELAFDVPKIVFPNYNPECSGGFNSGHTKGSWSVVPGSGTGLFENLESGRGQLRGGSGVGLISDESWRGVLRFSR